MRVTCSVILNTAVEKEAARYVLALCRVYVWFRKWRHHEICYIHVLVPHSIVKYSCTLTHPHLNYLLFTASIHIFKNH